MVETKGKEQTVLFRAQDYAFKIEKEGNSLPSLTGTATWEEPCAKLVVEGWLLNLKWEFDKPNLWLHVEMESSDLGKSSIQISVQIGNVCTKRRFLLNSEYIKLGTVKDLWGKDQDQFPDVFSYNVRIRVYHKKPKPQESDSMWHKMLKDKTFHDVLLIDSQSKTAPAHRAVLAASSPVFQVMMDAKAFRSAQEKVLHLDFTTGTVRAGLRYIYTMHHLGSVDEKELYSGRDPTWDETLELHRFAHFYELQPLATFAEKKLGADLQQENLAALISYNALLSVFGEVISQFIKANPDTTASLLQQLVGQLKDKKPEVEPLDAEPDTPSKSASKRAPANRKARRAPAKRTKLK